MFRLFVVLFAVICTANQFIFATDNEMHNQEIEQTHNMNFRMNECYNYKTNDLVLNNKDFYEFCKNNQEYLN